MIPPNRICSAELKSVADRRVIFFRSVSIVETVEFWRFYLLAFKPKSELDLLF